MDGIHYLVRENKKIKALVGAYPVSMEIFCGQEGTMSLPGRGIGAVSVHPYSRSLGYMKTLMHTAIEDMKRDGIVFSYLQGQRQRYEYYGYTSAGCTVIFNCTETNITHTMGRQWNTSLTLEKVKADDTALLDQIHILHEAKSFRMHRSRNKLFDILSSWKTDIYSINDNGRFFGYFINKNNDSKNNSCITEIQLLNFSRLPEVMGLFFRSQNEMGLENTAEIYTGSHELEKITVLSGFAENYLRIPSCKFSVFNFPRLTDALVKFKAASGKIREGSFVLQIEEKEMRSKIRLFAGKDGAGAVETDEQPVLSMNSLEAIQFLLSPLAATANPVIHENTFLQDILPLPLIIENADGM